MGGFEIFGDYTHQHRHHVLTFPLAGVTSDENEYLMSGASFQVLPWLKPRIAYSIADYSEDTDIPQRMLLTGVDLSVHKNVTVMIEHVYWRQEEPGSDQTIDRSLNLVLYVNF